MKNTVKAYFRKDYKRTNGENPIYLRLTIERVKKDYSLNISCPAEYWNEKKASINSQYENAQVNNDIIMAALKRANDILYDYNINHKKLTFHDFEHQFLLQKTDSFYAFVENELENNKKTFHNSEGSVSTIKTDLSKLKNTVLN